MVSLVAIVAIFFVVMITFKSLALPFVLLLAIEAGIWINLAIPYFTGTEVNFIGYLVINTVQLGATIDYGILLTTHYLSHRRVAPRTRGGEARAWRDVPIAACVGRHIGYRGIRARLLFVDLGRVQLGAAARTRGFIVARSGHVPSARVAYLPRSRHPPRHLACELL